MSRFFHECFSDPALGAVMAFALIIVVVMTWLILKDKINRRRFRHRMERRRGDNKERRARPNPVTERPG
jgi:hypothetical protein